MGQVLGYWLKAPLSTMTNSLFRQRACIENLMRAALSLPPCNHMFLIKEPAGFIKAQNEAEVTTPIDISTDKKLVSNGVYPEKVYAANGVPKKELYAA